MRSLYIRVITVAVMASLFCSVAATETPFQYQFEYKASSPQLHNQATVSGPRVRWNTQSIVSGFGMERGGRLDLQVTNFELAMANATHNPAAVPVVFTLYNIDQWRAYSVLKLREVHLRSDFVLCHYPAALRFAIPPPGPDNALPWMVYFDVPKASQYTLQAQVCGAASVNVSGRVSMVNVGYDGLLSEHLGVQEMGLRPLYKVLLVAYLVGLVSWVLECYVWHRNVPKICYAFQAAIQVKALSIALKLGYYHERSMHGEVSEYLDFAQDMGESATSAMLLGVSILGSLGWSITRSSLSRREGWSLILVAILYLVVTINKALCRPTDTQKCRAYLLSEYALQSMLMLGVIVGLNFTIAQLKLEINYERWNSFITPLTYMKLDQYERFRFVFLGYLMLPTSLLILNLVVVTPPGYWRYAWVNTLLGEAATLVIVICIGLVVRPVDAYIYSRVARSTDASATTPTGTDPIEPPTLESPSRRDRSPHISTDRAALIDYLIHPAAIDSTRSNP